MLSWIGTTLVTSSGKWSRALESGERFVNREEGAGDVVTRPHLGQYAASLEVIMPNGGWPFGPWSLGRGPSGSKRRRRDAQIVDHPAFVPAALVVDHEQSGYRKDIVERARVIGIAGSRASAPIRRALSRWLRGRSWRPIRPHRAGSSLMPGIVVGENAGLEAGVVEQ